MKPIKILIVDDHTILRDGLKMLIADHPEFCAAGEAETGEQALELIAELDPDILLLDLVMPGMGGMGVLRALGEAKGSKRRLQVIVLSGAIDAEDIPKAFELGARGLVKKDSATNTLVDCLRTVLAGQYWFGGQSAETLDDVLQRCRSASKKARPENYGLTPREIEIIEEVVSGGTNKEIARQFSISEETVKHHITRVFDKLGVYNRLELTLFVYHHGILAR